jgi:chemotaxis protein MotA
MDITTIFGLLMGIGAVLISFLMEGGHLSSLLQVPAMVLVIFGTFGASIITTSFNQFASLPKLFKIILFEKKLNPQDILEKGHTACH